MGKSLVFNVLVTVPGDGRKLPSSTRSGGFLGIGDLWKVYDESEVNDENVLPGAVAASCLPVMSRAVG